MFIPLHDANNLKHISAQYVTIGLIAANVVVYFLTAGGSEAFAEAAVVGFGYIPVTLFGDLSRPPEMVYVPDGEGRKPVTVKTGLDNGVHVEIVEGLQSGAEVLVTQTSLPGGGDGNRRSRLRF